MLVPASALVPDSVPVPVPDPDPCLLLARHVYSPYKLLSFHVHTLFQLPPRFYLLVMVDGCPAVRHSSLTIVDLAGNDRKPVTTATGSSPGPSPYTFAINLSLSKLRKVANELALAQSLGYGSNDDDNDDNDDDGNVDDDEEEEGGYGHVALDSDDDDDDNGNHRHHSQHSRSRSATSRSRTHASARASVSASVVSYKESVLTFLLKDALEGDSRTLVITTLSPLDRHRESSVSTMAFAGESS